TGDELSSEATVGEEMEMVYLTLSWWILHVGWKDVRERVRREVEEVIDGCVPFLKLLHSFVTSVISVSLKTKLSVLDLFRLIGDIRRRVEHEITFEGCERRIKYFLILLQDKPPY